MLWGMCYDRYGVGKGGLRDSDTEGESNVFDSSVCGVQVSDAGWGVGIRIKSIKSACMINIDEDYDIGEFHNQRSTTATRRSYHSPAYMSRTIFPPALFSSIVRCASTISSNGNVFPTLTFNVPFLICCTISSKGVFAKSFSSP